MLDRLAVLGRRVQIAVRLDAGEGAVPSTESVGFAEGVGLAEDVARAEGVVLGEAVRPTEAVVLPEIDPDRGAEELVVRRGHVLDVPERLGLGRRQGVGGRTGGADGGAAGENQSPPAWPGCGAASAWAARSSSSSTATTADEVVVSAVAEAVEVAEAAEITGEGISVTEASGTGAWARSAGRCRRASGIGVTAALSGSPESPSRISSPGTSTTTLVPPNADGRNSICRPIADASRATTWKPRRMSSPRASMSVRGGSSASAAAIRALAVSYCSGSMPRPRSSISIASPRPTTAARTSTGVGGLEKLAAFSISSATTCAIGPTARSESHGWPSTSSTMRRYSWTSPCAARSTSSSGTGLRHFRCGWPPAMMTRFSS